VARANAGDVDGVGIGARTRFPHAGYMEHSLAYGVGDGGVEQPGLLRGRPSQRPECLAASDFCMDKWQSLLNNFPSVVSDQRAETVTDLAS
jgi:hypothetical protein